MPISNKQKQILAFPFTKYDAIVCDGAIRSGKTAFMTIAFIDWAMREFNHQRFGICGKTVGSAIENIISPYLGLSYAGKYRIRFRRSEKILEISNGKHENIFEIFGGKDESSYMLIQGRTLAGVLFDEVVLQAESFVKQALARCSVEGSKVWFNCNPESPQHWFYRDWICQPEKHNAIRIQFELKDNPSLSAQKLKWYESNYDGVFYQRYILGQWVLAEGLVYSNFGEENITDYIPESGEYYISIDYGTMNPFSAGLWCIRGKKAVRITEYYYNGRERKEQKTDSEYADAIDELVKKIPENSELAEIVVDPSAASFITELRQRGYNVRKAKNDVLDGIRLVSKMLKNGNIKIHRSCEDCITEFGLYRWDDKAAEDTVIKENDHCLTGETLVDTITGQKRIKDLVGKIGFLWSINRKGKRCVRLFFGVRKTDKDRFILRIKLKNGKSVDCTLNHKILTEKGWKRAEYLRDNDKIIDIFYGKCKSNTKKQKKSRGVGVKSIERIGKDDVYNLEVIGTHCFSVNGGIIVHNCMDDIRYFCSTIMKDRVSEEEYTPIIWGMMQ